MMLTTATPREVIIWFEEVDTAHEMLCCLIASNPAHLSILDQLIDNFAGTDCALGPKIGFILFGNAQVERFIALQREEGGSVYLPGVLRGLQEHNPPAERNVWSMRKLFGNYGGRLWDGKEENRYTVEQDFTNEFAQLRSQALTELKQQSMHVADEWISALDVARSQLPVLCVLIKHTDPVIISLGAKIDVESTLAWLARLADIAERTDEPIARAHYWNLRAQERFCIAKRIEGEIRALENTLIRQLDVLADQITADNVERNRIAQIADASNFSVETCRSLLSSLPVDRIRNQRIRQHSIGNILRTIKKLAHQRECYQNNLPNEPEKRSIAEIIENLNKRREQTAALVAELAKSGNVAKTMPAVKVFNFAEVVAQRTLPFLDLAEKVDKIIQWVKGVPTPQ
jgi:hypothetical protein